MPGWHPCPDCGQGCWGRRCQQCAGRGKPRQPTPPANPWAGRAACPSCRSSDWTLPYNGKPAAGRWRCVWPCHRWFHVRPGAKIGP